MIAAPAEEPPITPPSERRRRILPSTGVSEPSGCKRSLAVCSWSPPLNHTPLTPSKSGSSASSARFVQPLRPSSAGSSVSGSSTTSPIPAESSSSRLNRKLSSASPLAQTASMTLPRFPPQRAENLPKMSALPCSVAPMFPPAINNVPFIRASSCIRRIRARWQRQNDRGRSPSRPVCPRCNHARTDRRACRSCPARRRDPAWGSR